MALLALDKESGSAGEWRHRAAGPLLQGPIGPASWLGESEAR